MPCISCDSTSGRRTRIEFLPSKREIEVSMCEQCMHDVAATKSINVVRVEKH